MKLRYLTALYSSLDQEYAQVMSGPYDDLSQHGLQCRIVAALKEGRISGFWRPVVAVGDDRYQKIQIERLYDICPNIYYLDFLIDGRLSVISQFLLRHGHKARPYFTQVIDLTKTEEELHADLRKSYKSLINKDSHDTYVAQDDYLPEYQMLHERVSDRIRSQASWSVQMDMLAKCEAFIVMRAGDIAGGLFYCNTDYCYYASGKAEKGVNSHSVVWKAITEAKGLGCRFFELGEQIFSGDPKLVNISKFKMGFGGRTQTRLILEKAQ